MPAKLVYYTNGRTRTLKLGPYSVKLLNRGPKTMDVGGRMAPLVFQALRHLGRRGVTPEVIDRLRLALSRKDKAELKDNISYAAAWMMPVIERITSFSRQEIGRLGADRRDLLTRVVEHKRLFFASAWCITKRRCPAAFNSCLGTIRCLARADVRSHGRETIFGDAPDWQRDRGKGCESRKGKSTVCSAVGHIDRRVQADGKSGQEPLFAAATASRKNSTMGRPLRTVAGELPYHVLNRANARTTVFRAIEKPEDYDAFWTSVFPPARPSPQAVAKQRFVTPFPHLFPPTLTRRRLWASRFFRRGVRLAQRPFAYL